MEKLIHRQNYLDIQKYLHHLETDRELSQASILRIKSYLNHLLLWAMDIPLTNADTIDPGLVQYLKVYKSPYTGEILSRESWEKILGYSHQFFDWAVNYYSRYPLR